MQCLPQQGHQDTHSDLSRGHGLLCVCPIHKERVRDEEFMSFELWLPDCEFHIEVDTDMTDEEIVFD